MLTCLSSRELIHPVSAASFRVLAFLVGRGEGGALEYRPCCRGYGGFGCVFDTKMVLAVLTTRLSSRISLRKRLRWIAEYWTPCHNDIRFAAVGGAGKSRGRGAINGPGSYLSTVPFRFSLHQPINCQTNSLQHTTSNFRIRVELLANSRRPTFKVLHEKTNTPTTTLCR